MVKQINDIEELVDRELNNSSGTAIAIKELTSVLKEDVDIPHESHTNMDFKTRLSIKEISAHACLEWLNEVIQDKDKWETELRIVRLTERMKRLRVSVDGKARESIEKIFIHENTNDENSKLGGFMKKMFVPKSSNVL